jgi:hypothetical protein
MGPAKACTIFSEVSPDEVILLFAKSRNVEQWHLYLKAVLVIWCFTFFASSAKIKTVDYKLAFF